MSYGICQGSDEFMKNSIVKPMPKPAPQAVYDIFGRKIDANPPTPTPTPCVRWCPFGYSPICAERKYRTTVEERKEKRTFRTEACMNADTCVAGHSWRKISEGACPGDFRAAGLGNNDMYSQPENYYQATPPPTTATPSGSNPYLQQLLEKLKNPAAAQMPSTSSWQNLLKPTQAPASGQSLFQQFLTDRQQFGATPAPTQSSNPLMELFGKQTQTSANKSGKELMQQFLAKKQLSNTATSPTSSPLMGLLGLQTSQPQQSQSRSVLDQIILGQETPMSAPMNPFMHLLATQATPTQNPLMQLYSSKMKNTNPLLQNILQSNKKTDTLSQFGLANNPSSAKTQTNPFLVGNKLPLPSTNEPKPNLLKLLG